MNTRNQLPLLLPRASTAPEWFNSQIHSQMTVDCQVSILRHRVETQPIELNPTPASRWTHKFKPPVRTSTAEIQGQHGGLGKREGGVEGCFQPSSPSPSPSASEIDLDASISVFTRALVNLTGTQTTLRHHQSEQQHIMSCPRH